MRGRLVVLSKTENCSDVDLLWLMTFERMAFELWILERILNDWNPLNPSVSCQGSCCYPDPHAGLGELLTEDARACAFGILEPEGCSI